MKPTFLLIFGAPQAGTPLMIQAPTLALDLPLKVLISEDDDGAVWITQNSVAYLRSRHAVLSESTPLDAAIRLMMEVAGNDQTCSRAYRQLRSPMNRRNPSLKAR